MINRFSFSQWFELWEVDKLTGERLLINQDFTDWFNDHNDISISISKSITSNGDTATVEIWNHRIIEQMYAEKLAFFDRFFKKQYEVDIMQWYECGHADRDDAHVQCIFSGDLDDISIRDDTSVSDQALSITATSGKRAALRVIANKKYSAGITYRDVVIDIFQMFAPGYELAVLDDPFGKLNKRLPRARTYHEKAADVLNGIARDLEMTWGFAENPWRLSERRIGGTDPTTGFKPKHAYFVDKASVFDISGLHGSTPIACNGSTGKLGRIGYTKSQFTFSHLYDPPLNIGMPVAVSDFGTMKDGVEFIGRVNRLNISNDTVQIEAAYIDPETGLAILDEDKSHSGALVL